MPPLLFGIEGERARTRKGKNMQIESGSVMPNFCRKFHLTTIFSNVYCAFADAGL